MLKVRLYRPFSARPPAGGAAESARAVAVLDRTKEPGALAEPLYLDVMTALAEAFNRGERRDATAHYRRPLRSLLQGVWSGMRAGDIQ